MPIPIPIPIPIPMRMPSRAPRQRRFASLVSAALAALALSGAAPLRAETVQMLTANGTPCTQITQVACWAIVPSGAPLGRLPGAGDWVIFGGDNASQAAGRNDTFQTLSVFWLPGILGSHFPSRFTQRGNIHAALLSVDDGRYTLAQGAASFNALSVGGDSLQGKRPDATLRSPVLEIMGGTMTATAAVRVGNDAVALDERSSGEVRLTGTSGTLVARGGLQGAGLEAQRVRSTLVLDGGRLVAPSIRGFTDIVVGSGAPHRGVLDVGTGQSAEATRLEAALDGGRAALVVAGSGARLSVRSAVLAAGAGSDSLMAVGLAGPGTMQAGSLAMAVGAGSKSWLEIEGRGSEAATLEVTGRMDVGLGGDATLYLRARSQARAASAQVGGTGTGSARVNIAGDNASWIIADDLVIGRGGGVTMGPGTLLQAARIEIAPQGALRVDRAYVLATTMQIAPESLLSIDILGNRPGLDHAQLLGDGTLTFGGALQLNFLGGFVPQDGQRFQLFGFAGYAGLDAGQISVSGFDAARLDFSQMGVDGSFGVAALAPLPAVSEPATALLGLAGLSALWAARRRCWQTGGARPISGRAAGPTLRRRTRR